LQRQDRLIEIRLACSVDALAFHLPVSFICVFLKDDVVVVDPWLSPVLPTITTFRHAMPKIVSAI
jgi:hypothetical protein